MANRIRYKTRRYFGFLHPIMTWEYHCFGYRKGGHESNTVYDGSETEIRQVSDTRFESTTTHKSHVERYAFFKRHEEYPKNFLFSILEILMNIVSYIRVFLGKFLIIGSIIAMTAGAEDIVFSYLMPALTAVYVGSFVIPLAGYIVRNVFGLDQKMDDICDENEWMRWSEYKDE